MKTIFKPNLSQLKIFGSLAIIILATLVPLKAFAYDADFYSMNDIGFYNPDSCAGGSTASDTSVGSVTMTKSAKLKLIFQLLLKGGFNAVQVSAIMGNMEGESSFDSNEWEFPSDHSKGGYGLAQWTGGRRTLLFNYLDRHGYARDSIPGQIAWLLIEYNNRGYKRSLRGTAFDSGTDIDAATRAWEVHFEAAGIPHMDRRLKSARDIYALYKNLAPAVTTTTSGGSSGGSTGCAGSSSATGCQNGWDLSGSCAMVFYDQCSSPWVNDKFGNDSLCYCGCGPTSLAMIVATLTGDKSVNPENMAAFYAAHGGQESGCGSNWAWSVIEQKWSSLKVTDLGKDMTRAKAVLSRGGLVLFSWTGAPFTGNKHIMVMRKFTTDGKIYIASSGGSTNRQQSDQAWDESIFTNGYHGPAVAGRGSSGYLKGLWGIEKK